ncbi:MAG TPA: antibiotic biosynthesis monooxygenase family protein [Candidatus Nanopelagicales bacterium]|nr:antibiotic biosynthesis monooxygenase family protein [Candidatus Nanopelagicales bacterium]
MTTPSFIAIVEFTVARADRPAALAQLESERRVVRAMPGCLGFRAFESVENDTDLTVLHEWVDRTAFDDYLASEAFARSGAVLRPLMTATPSSRRFQVELLDTVA